VTLAKSVPVIAASWLRSAHDAPVNFSVTNGPETEVNETPRTPPFSGSPDVSVGHVTVTLPGSGGHSPPSFSIAREINA